MCAFGIRCIKPRKKDQPSKAEIVKILQEKCPKMKGREDYAKAKEEDISRVTWEDYTKKCYFHVKLSPKQALCFVACFKQDKRELQVYDG